MVAVVIRRAAAGVVASVVCAGLLSAQPASATTGEELSASEVVEGVGDSQAVVQDVGAQGQRVAFIINTPTDPTEYRLDFDGAATLELDSTGAVMVLDAHSQLLALVSPPWARDANGTEVPTRFVVEGNTLTQVVEHTTGGSPIPLRQTPTYSFVGGAHAPSTSGVLRQPALPTSWAAIRAPARR